jgi:Skp family chaperone for outer membrane proteins
MKIRAVVLSCLIGVVVLSMGYGYSRAESKAEERSFRIGVVNVRKIFRDCKKGEKHRVELSVEESKVNAVLQKLKREIEVAEAGLGVLRRDSSDYLELERDTAQKRGSYLSQKKFFEKQLELRDQRWTEELYKGILEETREVGKQKDLDLVFAEKQAAFPMPSIAELMMTIETHKLLYCRGCLDITNEVMARLDEEESKVKDSKM